jgi:hypothetical protein
MSKSSPKTSALFPFPASRGRGGVEGAKVFRGEIPQGFAEFLARNKDAEPGRLCFIADQRLAEGRP